MTRTGILAGRILNYKELQNGERRSEGSVTEADSVRDCMAGYNGKTDGAVGIKTVECPFVFVGTDSKEEKLFAAVVIEIDEPANIGLDSGTALRVVAGGLQSEGEIVRPQDVATRIHCGEPLLIDSPGYGFAGEEDLGVV